MLSKKNNITKQLCSPINGLEALAMLRGKGVELIDPMSKIILLDLNLPKMGGMEFLKVLRADQGLAGFLGFIMTTANEDRDKVEAYKLNVAGDVLKPLSMENYISAVATLNNYWQLIEFPKSA